MTPVQMLRRVKPDSAPDPSPIIMQVDGLSADIVYQAQSEALHNNKCPVCHAGLDVEVDKKDHMVYYKCQRNPVFHEWRRTQSFLTRD